MAVRFMNYARVRHCQVPSIEDGPGWLFLMQHYGLPTRLLDWSQSPLTALFFAVREEAFADQDAIVWGLAPTRLNLEQTGKAAILGIGNDLVRPVFRDAWRAAGSSSTDGKILAITAQHVDVRQMVQASEFTLHGTPVPLEEQANSHKFLVKVMVPAGMKKGLGQALKLLHLTDSYFFPDLEHLAQDLQKTAFAVDENT